jgi:hypothetical protein
MHIYLLQSSRFLPVYHFCIAAEQHRASHSNDDLLDKYIKLRLRVRHAKRLQAFVGATPQEEQVFQQDAILFGDDDRKLVEMHGAAKSVLAELPKMMEQ